MSDRNQDVPGQQGLFGDLDGSRPRHRRRRDEEVELGEKKRDDGIKRASAGASEAWKKKAREALRSLAHEHAEITSEDIIERVGLPCEGRAMGGIMQGASGTLIERTERTVNARRPERHRAPIRVWRSLVRAGVTP